VHDFAANIFKIDVHALRGGGGELRFPVRVFVVDGRVEAEFAGEPLAFVVRAGDADHAASVDLADLPGNAAGGARGGGNHERFAGLRLGHVGHAEIRGDAGHPQDAKERAIRHAGDVRNFVEAARVRSVDEEVFLHAHQADDFFAGRQRRVARLDDFRQAEAAHHVAQGDGGQVGGAFPHPHAHGRVDGEIFYTGQRLALRRAATAATRGVLDRRVRRGLWDALRAAVVDWSLWSLPPPPLRVCWSMAPPD
jgi:hypothetical protein